MNLYTKSLLIGIPLGCLAGFIVGHLTNHLWPCVLVGFVVGTIVLEILKRFER